jgi:hypothetical protein
MIKKIALAFALMSSTANSQGIPIETIACGTTDQIRGILTDKYNETVKYRGLIDEKLIEEYWTNDQTGTYSFTRSNIEAGVTCVISAGEHSQKIAVILGSPS